jgi:hypothetical protein
MRKDKGVCEVGKKSQVQVTLTAATEKLPKTESKVPVHRVILVVPLVSVP